METYAFTLLLKGRDIADPDVYAALEDGGCDDAAFGKSGNVQEAEFDRAASSFAHAVLSAIHDVETAVIGLWVTRIESEDLVTSANIATRIERTRASVEMLIDGKRGPGNFPQPVMSLGGRQQLWRWADVVAWFADFLRSPIDNKIESRFIAAMNSALSLREQGKQLPPLEQILLGSWIQDHMLSTLLPGPLKEAEQQEKTSWEPLSSFLESNSRRKPTTDGLYTMWDLIPRSIKTQRSVA